MSPTMKGLPLAQVSYAIGPPGGTSQPRPSPTVNVVAGLEGEGAGVAAGGGVVGTAGDGVVSGEGAGGGVAGCGAGGVEVAETLMASF